MTKNLGIRIFLFCLFFIALRYELFSQVIGPDGSSVDVKILSGANLDFIFNSIAKYKSGLDPTNCSTCKTRLGITINDVAGGTDYLSWHLEVEAGDIDIKGTPPNTLPLSTIEITADKVGATCVGCFEYFPTGTPLSMGLAPLGSPITIVGTDPACGCPPADGIAGALYSVTTDWIDISYYIGTLPANNLLGNGNKPDLYSGVITFTIIMDP